MNVRSKRWLAGVAALAVAVAAAVTGGQAIAGSKHPAAAAKGLGPTPACSRAATSPRRAPSRST